MDAAPLATSAEATTAAAAALRAFRHWLAALDPDALTDREPIDLVAELERLKGAGCAAQARLTHAVRRSREVVSPQDVARSVGSEVALARRQSPTLGDRFVGMARALVDEMPHTMNALTLGSCSERHALLMVQVTSVLSLGHRAEVDRRVGPLLGRLGVRGTERAARRVAQELDVAAVVRRHDDAARSRRVTVRPAPDGMAYLTVLGPLVEVVGASTALRRRAQSVVSGQCPDEGPEGRAVAAVAADTALRLLSGREVGQGQPFYVHLVMTDRSLIGIGDPGRPTSEPARVPGHGTLPAPVARALVRGGEISGDVADVAVGTPAEHGAAVWLRRLFTSPDGRDLVAMDSRARLFSGLLRRMVVLRDDVCTTPWCEAPIAHADHTTPSRWGGATSLRSGTGKCARCNYVKEAPGWLTVAVPADSAQASAATAAPAARVATAERHDVRVTTPLGRHYLSQPPPLLGWGSLVTDRGATPPPPALPAPPAPPGRRGRPRSTGGESATRRLHPADRKRERVLAEAGRRLHRFRSTGNLERELCRYRT